MTSSSVLKYTNKLVNARVLIIGGSSGIGFGVAEALVEHGANVIISSSSQDRVNKAIQKLQSTYGFPEGRVQGFICNLSVKERLQDEVKALFSQVAKGGKLDHVVYTAGDAMNVGNLEDFSFDEIEQSGVVRFFGPLVVAQHLRANLNDGPATSYSMTTGGASDRPRKGWSIIMPYLTGLEGMCRALARDLAPIRVNVIGPGPVKTELWDSFQEDAFEALKADFENQMTTGTFGKVEDVAESYIYVMKDKNITGTMIRTNGGMLLI